jgi:hypothetical protein
MKKLNPPNVDDFTLIGQICNQQNIGGVSNIMRYLSQVENDYFSYILFEASHDCLKPSFTPAPAGSELLALYGREISHLKFIKDIRYKLSPDVCSMCGGATPTTVDHFLPKAQFNEYSIFSLNLVPACGCNPMRSNVLGVNGEKLLHPYFDDVLTKRLYSFSFLGNLRYPTIKIKQIVPGKNINFHLKSVVLKSNVKSFAFKLWERVTEDPLRRIIGLDRVPRPISVVDLKKALVSNLNAEDIRHDTPNNWHSFFWHGILRSSRVINYIHNLLP